MGGGAGRDSDDIQTGKRLVDQGCSTVYVHFFANVLEMLFDRGFADEKTSCYLGIFQSLEDIMNDFGFSLGQMKEPADPLFIQRHLLADRLCSDDKDIPRPGSKIPSHILRIHGIALGPVVYDPFFRQPRTFGR